MSMLLTNIGKLKSFNKESHLSYKYNMYNMQQANSSNCLQDDLQILDLFVEGGGPDLMCQSYQIISSELT